MTDDPDGLEAPVLVGTACTDLLAYPTRWINRRVETVELLSREETRRRVSIDFTLTDDQLESLELTDGIVVPISVLTKEARRNFDLRDESGRAIPVLGKEHNGQLAHVALLSAAWDALPSEIPSTEFEILAGELGQIARLPPSEAADLLGDLDERADKGDRWREVIASDQTCQRLLNVLWANYVLFAVLVPGGANRRVLKYSYGDDFNFDVQGSRLARLAPRETLRRLARPDRRRFVVNCPGAWRARSFHAEIAIPEELRIEAAVLVDFDSDRAVGPLEVDVNRAALYAANTVEPEADIGALVELSPERGGWQAHAAATSVVVAALLWLGVWSGLDAENPGAAVSLLLAGAALFSGLTAAQGEHRLVKTIFAGGRRALAVVTLAALAGSASLAMEIPTAQPVCVWQICAVLATVAALRLVWSAIRAPA